MGTILPDKMENDSRFRKYTKFMNFNGSEIVLINTEREQ